MLEELPKFYEDINEKLQATLEEKKEVGKQKYLHEFTQGIIKEEIAIDEKYYEEENFKYFEE